MRGYRLRQVEQYILENEAASLEEIGTHFGVSINTVRRDVAELLKMGGIEKVYGGVCAKRKNQLIPFEERHLKHLDRKQSIGVRAARFVKEGDVIYVDSGTTTVQLIEALKDSRHVTVVTNSLGVVIAAVPYKRLNVIMVTGQLERKTNSFIGSNTLRALDGYHVNKAFMAATGVSLEMGVTNSSLLEYEIKNHQAQSVAQVFLMVDSSKFGVAALTTYAQIEDFNTIITDRMPLAEYAAFCAAHDVELAMCEETEKKGEA